MRQNAAKITGLFFLSLAILLWLQSPVALSQVVKINTINGIAYVSGGVGLDEREMIQELAKDFNLKLVFAVKTGNYLAGVRVAIETAAGETVLETVADGPWFYANLPPGDYTVAAEAMGQREEEDVRVSKTGQSRLLFHWPGE